VGQGGGNSKNTPGPGTRAKPARTGKPHSGSPQNAIRGENPQNEYGGPATASQNHILNRRWLEEFGGLLGLRVSDVLGQDDITERDLLQYTYPSDAELQRVGVTGLFLGYYVPWDGYANARYAQAHGFEVYHTTVEGSMVDYENLDNAHMGIHDYFKYLKYGFGRATDLACMAIRRGRMTRDQAVTIVRQLDGMYPQSYLGVSLSTILREINMTENDWHRICDRFTNKKLFYRDADGQLVKDATGRPVLCSPLV